MSYIILSISPDIIPKIIIINLQNSLCITSCSTSLFLRANPRRWRELQRLLALILKEVSKRPRRSSIGNICWLTTLTNPAFIKILKWVSGMLHGGTQRGYRTSFLSSEVVGSIPSDVLFMTIRKSLIHLSIYHWRIDASLRLSNISRLLSVNFPGLGGAGFLVLSLTTMSLRLIIFTICRLFFCYYCLWCGIVFDWWVMPYQLLSSSNVRKCVSLGQSEMKYCHSPIIFRLLPDQVCWCYCHSIF